MQLGVSLTSKGGRQLRWFLVGGRSHLVVGRHSWNWIGSQNPHPVAENATRVGHPLRFPSGRFRSSVHAVASEQARFARGPGKATAHRDLSFQADLADATYYVVFGGFAFCDGEEFEGRGLVVGAKN